MDVKKGARKILKKCCQIPFRGRHRLADRLGALLAPRSGIEWIDIGEIRIPIDHFVTTYRYMYYGVYEENNVNFLKRILGLRDICFDAGANIGYMTAIMAACVGLEGKVYAFEPSSICFPLLTQCFDAVPNVQLCRAAISDRCGSAVFHDTPRVISRGFACLDEVERPSDSMSYEVQTLTVDVFCAANNIERIKFLKLDIEGSESLAIEGAKGMIKGRKIDYILIETSVDRAHDKSNFGINSVLRMAGYYSNRVRREGKLQKVRLEQLDGKRLDLIWTHLESDVLATG